MRKLLNLIAAYWGANGVVMLAAPLWWYSAVPGVTETGPANVHFIRDIGLGFVAAAAALSLAARPGAARALLVPALVFLGGHAGYHLVEMVTDGATPAAGLRDILIIVVPGFAPAVALFDRPRILKEA